MRVLTLCLLNAPDLVDGFLQNGTLVWLDIGEIAHISDAGRDEFGQFFHVNVLLLTAPLFIQALVAAKEREKHH